MSQSIAWFAIDDAQLFYQEVFCYLASTLIKFSCPIWLKFSVHSFLFKCFLKANSSVSYYVSLCLRDKTVRAQFTVSGRFVFADFSLLVQHMISARLNSEILNSYATGLTKEFEKLGTSTTSENLGGIAMF